MTKSHASDFLPALMLSIVDTCQSLCELAGVLSSGGVGLPAGSERGLAAGVRMGDDVFVCGGCDPYKALPVLRAAFRPGDIRVSEQKRGLVV